jgi:hypothetical protein
VTISPEESPAQEFPDEAHPSADTSPNPASPAVELHVEETDTESWREDLTGLLSLGALRAWFDWCGHRISIRTLSTSEELLVAHLMKEFEGGMGGMKAYATATAALSVESIDGQFMPVPLGEDPGKPYQWAVQRFNYAQRWYPPTIDAMLNAYLELENRQRAVLAGLGKALGPGVSAILGSSGSSGSPNGEGS